MYGSDDYVKLLIGGGPMAQSKYLIALRSTADHYGWTEEFEVWRPKTVRTEGGRVFCICPGRRGNLQLAGGRRHRICRSPSTAGTPTGMTNAFRVSNRCGLFDLAEIAHFTNIDWHWMTAPNGERIRRERWEEIYQGGLTQRKGGLVSV